MTSCDFPEGISLSSPEEFYLSILNHPNFFYRRRKVSFINLAVGVNDTLLATIRENEIYLSLYSYYGLLGINHHTPTDSFILQLSDHKEISEIVESIFVMEEMR